eukprot:GHUV01022392.1.p1 GENE.GHUV01022392.1~~GHUV01022392.1.p1  ORF type:complete len:220 (+),score=65.44 GHUV01022392.1:146-805(+)
MLPFGFAVGAPLVIPIGRSTNSRPAGSQQGSSEEPTTHSNEPRQQQQQQPQAPAVAGAGPSQQQQQRHSERQARPGDDDVIIIESGSDSDSDPDVIITGVSQRKRSRQAMMQPEQVQQQRHHRGVRLLQAGMQPVSPAGPAIPSWDQQPAAPRQRSPSPEPAIKCLICLEGIKTDNMATTPCGHIFCYDCLTDAVKAMKKCPKCRKTVQPKMVKRLYPN